jgi:hypothetical protein
MDVTDFEQCLSYIQLTSQSKAPWEALLPYGAGLLGVLVGFLINSIREKLKDGKSNKNKMICIDEDIHKLRHYMEVAAKECLEIICSIHDGSHTTAAKIYPTFRAPLLEEFFGDVAIKYSVQTRLHLKEIIALTSTLDQKLKKIFDLSPGYDMSVQLIDLIDSFVYGIVNCDGFYNTTLKETAEDLFNYLSVDQGKIITYQTMILNAKNNNKFQL